MIHFKTNPIRRKIYWILLLATCPSTVLPQPPSVQVASHRGDWRNYADNSLEGIESCIQMGVDIVEIDVATTRDGYLVLMHDRTLDRTTNGRGAVSDFTLEEIRHLRLRNGLGRVTNFHIPTFEEAMRLAKGRIRVNVDKGDDCFDAVYRILERTGTLPDAIIKSDRPYRELKAQFGNEMDQMIFMQIIPLHPKTTIDSIAPLLDEGHPYYEISFRHENRELLREIRALLHEIRDRLSVPPSIIWMNPLWDSLCGGHSDDRALTDPDGAWGYLIDELGAGILQTDRPALLLKYLREREEGASGSEYMPVCP
jgi:glycerophosphoryl diester phosphodiesterase